MGFFYYGPLSIVFKTCLLFSFKPFCTWVMGVIESSLNYPLLTKKNIWLKKKAFFNSFIKMM